MAREKKTTTHPPPSRLWRAPKVVVGGTFEILHRGHKTLLRKAFELGAVIIGLTSDIFAQKLKKRKVKDFKQRKKELADFIKKEFHSRAKIVKIEDKFGPTLKEDFDYIVVSPETYKTALLINKERQRANKKPIEIVKINFVLGKGRNPLSATKILKVAEAKPHLHFREASPRSVVAEAKPHLHLREASPRSVNDD